MNASISEFTLLLIRISCEILGFNFDPTSHDPMIAVLHAMFGISRTHIADRFMRVCVSVNMRSLVVEA